VDHLECGDGDCRIFVNDPRLDFYRVNRWAVHQIWLTGFDSGRESWISQCGSQMAHDIGDPEVRTVRSARTVYSQVLPA